MLVKLGSSDLMVSPVAMGCWPIAGMTSLDVNESDSLNTLNAAVDCGINFFDTAYCYGTDGVSERLLGQCAAGRRDQLVIATKCGVHWDQDGGKVIDGSSDRILSECDQSLQRMGIDHIDLMYLHRPDPRTPIAESAAALATLQKQGKIRYAGVSNVTPAELIEFHAVCPVVAAQLPFNLVQQQTRRDFGHWCAEQNVAICCYWPLMKGLLAGRIRRDFVFDPADKRRGYEIFQGENFLQAQDMLDELDAIAHQHQLTISQLVIVWTIAQSCITVALCGAKRAWQISETAKAMECQLSDETLKNIGQLARSRFASAAQ